MDAVPAATFATLLVAASLAPVAAATGTPPAPDGAAAEMGCTETHTYDVVARQIPVSYNRWGDFDPAGRLFVPAEKEDEVVAQVASRLRDAGLETAARTLEDPSLGSLEEAGLDPADPTNVDDVPRLEPFQPSPLVQPLVLRAHVGDCVRINLENKLAEPASIHVHDVEAPPGQGMALGQNEPDHTAPGATGTYVVRIPDDPAMEGAHFLHSHADARYQTKHGMFGAIMAEPPGTSWLQPDGDPNPTGPQAMITHPDQPDFREISVFYQDEIELVDRTLDPLPELSPYGEYGPGTKGINLRSEPFLDRFRKHDQLYEEGEADRKHDKSVALSSYTYGDPPVVPEAYVGDPTKFRLVNVGPGQAHVHHLHGGGIRWRLSPVGEDTNFTDGLTKYESGPTHEHPEPRDHPTSPAAGASSTALSPTADDPLLEAWSRPASTAAPTQAAPPGDQDPLPAAFRSHQDPAHDGHDHGAGSAHGHGGGDGTHGTELFLPARRGAGSILVPDAEALGDAPKIAVGQGEDQEVRRIGDVYGNKVTLERALLGNHTEGTPVEPLTAEDGVPSSMGADGATAGDVDGNVSSGEYHAHNERTDVQMLSPGVSFNAEIECGAGGCQGSPGDFLFHCHIAEHYLAGMWGIWRTYDTKQPGLAELPDRAGATPDAVDSTALPGTTLPNGTTLTEDNLRGWVEDQLPPQGEPVPGGASTWDWAVEETPDGPLYLGEPETEHSWANHEPSEPGEREPLAFNPENGRIAYPMLEPHLAERPPFAPRHGPAPYLGEEVAGDARDRLCPSSTRPINYSVVATGADVAYNDRGDRDPDGMVFTHAEDADAVRNGSRNPKSLVLRANRGDCVDVTLTSQLPEEPDPALDRKVNIHTHLVQFDMQATDGSIVGFNYETSVRSAQSAGAPLAAPAEAGDRQLELAEQAPSIREGALVAAGATQPTMEALRVADVAGTTVTLADPLARDHPAGELVSPEFVRYRWYADVRLGTVYFHDHVDGLESWRHGLFGALVVEPRDSRWLDPEREELLPPKEGTINPDALNEHVLDIVGPNGTYRELVLTFQDRSAVMDGRSLASFNLRSAPFDRRAGGHPLSSQSGGDPATDTLRAYPGDDVTMRLLYGGQSTSKGVATFGVTGHRFPTEPESPGSRPKGAISLGISSQHDLQLACGAGGCHRLPGDYLYSMTQPGLLEKGAWGILRVHDEAQPDLQPLPDNRDWAPGSIPDRTDRRYEVAAVEADVTFNERTGTEATRQVFVPASQADAVEAGEANPQPLVLRAAAGDVVEVDLTNRLDEPVSLHAGVVAANASAGDLGIPVGGNDPALVPPGATGTYRWHADRAVGVAPLASFADPADDPRSGLYGALVVEPRGATVDEATGPTANVTLPDGTTVREHVLQYAAHDPDFEASVMPYDTAVDGITSVNYRSAPIWNRTGARTPAVPTRGEPVGGPGVHTCQLDPESCTAGAQGVDARTGLRHPLNPLAYSSAAGTPATPVLDADQGEPLLVRATTGTGDQIQSHALPGHAWREDPAMKGSRLVDTVTLGTRETSDAWIPAAGPGGPGDYLYGSHRDAFREAGAWGIVRVGSP